MTSAEINQRIQNAKALDFGMLFNQCIELFKKVWVQGFVTLLLTMILAIPIIMIVYIPLVFMGIADSYDPYMLEDIGPLLAIVIIILYLFALVAISIIAFAFKAAFYRICRFKDMENMGKEDYFFFFKKPYLNKTIALSLAYVGITFLATLLCFLPVIYVSVPMYLMVVIYAFNPDLSVSDIIKLSFELGNKKWLITFGLGIVTSFLAAIVGMLMCFFGIYITASFGFLAHYYIYKEVVGFNDGDSTKLIEERLDALT